MRGKSTTGRNGLAKLPEALKPLIEREQWAVYREIKQEDGSISRPPRQARNPNYFANVNDPSTWSDHATAVKAVKDGKADGLSFVLTRNDSLALLDVDSCRNPRSGSVDGWAQDHLDQFNGAYMEVSPSDDGLHVWGETSNGASNKNRAFHLTIGGKSVAVEAYYHTKAITVTGRQIGNAKKLVNVDKPLQQIIAWGDRIKVQQDTQKRKKRNRLNGGKGHSIEHIDRIVREGPVDGGNRSDQFHTVVGHYFGIGWNEEQICEVFEQHPEGVADKVIAKNLLEKEVARSFGKFKEQAEAQIGRRKASKKKRAKVSAKTQETPPEPVSAEINDGLKLPPFYAHGERTGSLTHREWWAKGVIPKTGVGLLSGQWGTFKTFVAIDLAVALCAGQSFLDHKIKQQCGVLLLAYEGASEVPLRVNAAVLDKCEGVERIAFRWYDDTDVPRLTDDDALDKLIAMAREVDSDLQLKLDRRLGVLIVDTLMAAAGYQGSGENDAAAVQEVMTVLRKLAHALDVFVLAIDHYGKNIEAGTRGSSSKEASVDLVLACLGTKSLSGSVSNTRLAVRKNRGGRQGQQFPFSVREVAAPEPDEDGDEVTTLVIDWLPASALSGVAQAPINPWTACCRREDQKTTMVRLERALTDAQTEHGAELPVSSDGPLVRMVDQELVRKLFYERTPAEGTPKQQRQVRSLQFNRAFGLAYREELVGIREIEGVTYLWLSRITHEDDEMGDDPGVDTSASTLPSSSLGRSVDAQVSTLSGQAEANRRKVEEAERTSLRRQAEAERRRSGP